MRVLPIASFISIGLGAFVSQALAGSAFTNRAAFEAALVAFTIEEFENAPLVGDSFSGAVPSIAFGTFGVSTSPSAAKVLDVSSAGAVNSTPSGSRYLYLDTDIGLSGLTASFNFAGQVSAFGFDYSANFESGNILTVNLDGQTFTLPGSAPNQAQFWGYIDDPGQTFASPGVLNQTRQSALGIDRVTFSAVPEPASLSVFLAALASAVRRDRRTS